MGYDGTALESVVLAARDRTWTLNEQHNENESAATLK